MNLLAKGIASGLLRWIVGPRPDPDREVDPARFDIPVRDAQCRARIQGILTAFFDGFEQGLRGPEDSSPAGEGVPPLYRPFFHEGAAMGFLPRGYLQLRSPRRSVEAFEATVGEEDPFLFLRYVGLGFWLGFDLPRWSTRRSRLVDSITRSRYRPLVFDGLGFKRGFFDSPRLDVASLRKDPSPALSLRLEPLLELQGDARRSAMNGFGRSLWFLFMDRPLEAIGVAKALGEDAPWVLGGLGLAAAFTFVDDLSRAYGIADGLTGTDAAHFVKGIRIALYVRHRSNHEHLEGVLEPQGVELRRRAGRDLEHALRVGARVEQRDDFIDSFHAGCLGEP